MDQMFSEDAAAVLKHLVESDTMKYNELKGVMQGVLVTNSDTRKRMRARVAASRQTKKKVRKVMEVKKE